MRHPWLDQPSEVRAGEELDVGRLVPFLQKHLPGFTGPLNVAQFPGGHSNLTYLLRSGTHEWVLRRPPFGARIRSAHDMGREFHVLSNLVRVYSRVPEPLLYCEDTTVLGAPFYLMERIEGVVLRAAPPPGLDLSTPVMRRLSEAFIDNLVDIHAVDYVSAGLRDLGRPAGYAARQVRGWTKRYLSARTDDLPRVERLAAWLAENLPPESEAALLHNGYKYDNLVLDPNDLSIIRGVLDWEMATLGDPLMDLGTTLGYWIDADDPEEFQALAFGLTSRPGNLTRRELAERYARASRRDLQNLLFYYVYALFKIAVIAQQIYARYRGGHTTDVRFAQMIDLVHAMGLMGELALAKGRIDRLSS